mmetsp:Transcript_16000/g.24126  ORF Transcript_16000/g.24126 Transcript_16000/m.24126 type:complete len:206 (-) Transcript_16000:1939-2556(-)
MLGSPVLLLILSPATFVDGFIIALPFLIHSDTQRDHGAQQRAHYSSSTVVLRVYALPDGPGYSLKFLLLAHRFAFFLSFPLSSMLLCLCDKSSCLFCTFRRSTENNIYVFPASGGHLEKLFVGMLFDTWKSGNPPQTLLLVHTPTTATAALLAAVITFSTEWSSGLQFSIKFPRVITFSRLHVLNWHRFSFHSGWLDSPVRLDQL